MDLRDKVCTLPFQNMEVHNGANFLCCPSWLKVKLPKGKVLDAWHSKEANSVRDSILEGSFKYCDSNVCPHLSSFKRNPNSIKAPLFDKNNIPEIFNNKIDEYKVGRLSGPTNVHFCQDRSCNLKCPSCRLEMIMESSKGIQKVKKSIQDIEDSFSEDVRKLTITGTGDPFISVAYRDFLRNFDRSKYPNLEKIHLHTNASKWTKEMWDSMPAVHKYVKTCEISIDAGTKNTYENSTRLLGDWDTLISNLEFISTTKVQHITTSFVVQDTNFREMEQFYDLMLSIFGQRVTIYFGRILNWGTFTDEQFLEKQVWNTNHKDYDEFVATVNKVVNKPQVAHNLSEFLYKKEAI